MTAEAAEERVRLREMRACFEGVIPAVVATADRAGTPNVTYLSRVHVVDDERIALSNQFFSKTVRNLAENPRASVLIVDPRNYNQFRLALLYERTERRGPVFEQLRHDVDAVAALTGMQDVFKLRSADVYRVLSVERVLGAAQRNGSLADVYSAEQLDDTTAIMKLSELQTRVSRCTDLDTLVRTVIDGLHTLLGYDHALLLLLDEDGRRLYTLASRGYETEGVGSEVVVGEGLIGMAAQRAAPVRLGSVHQMRKYSRRVRRSYEATEAVEPGREIPLPGLPDAHSQAAVPMMAMGQLVGVLMVESVQPAAYGETDITLLMSVAAAVASAIEIERQRTAAAEDSAVAAGGAGGIATAPSSDAAHVRFYAVDGSTFLDGDYLIKGVAGRILWALLGHYDRDQRVEFTNKEVRLDPSLELPDLRDNFESRLILLKRRLEERDAPIHIEKTGRGRFRLVVDRNLRLDLVP